MDMEDVNEEIDELEEEVSTLNFTPSFIIVAIDTHPSMFITRPSFCDNTETHPFKDALTACFEVLDSLALSVSKNGYHQFGVLLADQDDKASLIEIENNVLDSIKFMKKECRLSNVELKDKYERKGDFDVAGFFLLCKKKFKSINSAYFKRKILFITNNPDPVNSDAQKRFAAINEAKSFEGNNIYFEIVSMIEDFDYRPFYNELFHLYTEKTWRDEMCEDKDGLVEKLLSAIVFRYIKLKSKFFPIQNDFNRYLNVLRVSYYKSTKLIANEAITDNGEMLQQIRDEATYVKEEEFPYTLELDVDENIEFSHQEYLDTQCNDLPLGLHLQYISDRQSDPAICHAGTTILKVDPKEELTYFDEFWQYCFDRNKTMICVKKTNKLDSIRFVELIPKFANSEKIFLIKSLVFHAEYDSSSESGDDEDDDDEPPTEYDEKKTSVVRKLIDNLSFDYNPKSFVDVVYAKHTSYVKAKLLDEEEEEVVDNFADIDESIDKQMEDVLGKLKYAFSLEDPEPEKSKKRKAANENAGKSSQRASKK